MNRYTIRITIAAASLVVSALTTPCFAAPDFASVADSHEASTLTDRRHLHEFPELSGREFETQAYLRDRIAEIPGVELIDGDWGTGLVAILRGATPGPSKVPRRVPFEDSPWRTP